MSNRSNQWEEGGPWTRTPDKYTSPRLHGAPTQGSLCCPWSPPALRRRGTARREAGKRRACLPSFWRIFGATLVSIAALVTITLAQQFASILTEVRRDLNRLYESRGELARKDEVDAARKDVEAAASSLVALRERTLLLEQQLRAAGEERKQLARELQELREWRAGVAGRRGALSSPVVLGEPRASR